MRVFFDCEFTGLHQDTTLVSVGCVAESGETFYAECMDYDRLQVDDWLRANVIAHLQLTEEWEREGRLNGSTFEGVVGTRAWAAQNLASWLSQWDHVEMWGDCLAYDWVLFCELFGGGAECLPRNVSYIPFDLCTLFKLHGVDPDISRATFSRVVGTKHHALDDALMIRACVQKLLPAQDTPGAPL